MQSPVVNPPNGKPPAHREIERLLALALECGMPDPYSGKRKWMRFRSGLALEMTTEPNDCKPWLVHLHNMSGGGFAAWSKKSVTARQPIYIREYPDGPPTPWVSGRVRHITSGIRGFLIGAMFDDPVTPED